MIQLPKDKINPELRADLQATLTPLARRVQAIWSGRTALPHFTDHGPHHCARIEEHLTPLLRLLNNQLNLAESYILKCSVWTHDIGMQDPKFALGDLADKPITEFNDSDFIAIRNRHPEASQAWIMRTPEDLHLERNAFVVPIGIVARAHSNYDFQDVQEVRYVEGYTVRLRLLAILLTIADELDLDTRRVNMDALKQFSISAESKEHWWCHHYVDAVRIIDHTPHIYMSMPKEYQGIREEDWKLRATAGICKQLVKQAVRDTLAKEGCWLNHPQVVSSPDDCKLGWPCGLPLDIRGAVQADDLQLLREYPSKALTNMMGLNLYGVSFTAMNDEERDRVAAGVVKLSHAWTYIIRAQLEVLSRHLREQVLAVLDRVTLDPLTRIYLLNRAHWTMMGQFAATVLPMFGAAPHIPATPDDEFVWQRTREHVEYTFEGHAQNIDWDATRGRAIRECLQYKAELEELIIITQHAKEQIVIAAVIDNRHARLDDDGMLQAFIQTALIVNNQQTGPLLKAAVEEMENDPNRPQPTL